MPLERMTGEDGVRGRDVGESAEERLEDARDKKGEERGEGGDGEVVGKGTTEGISIRGGGSTAGENLPELMERRSELRGV